MQLLPWVQDACKWGVHCVYKLVQCEGMAVCMPLPSKDPMLALQAALWGKLCQGCCKKEAGSWNFGAPVTLHNSF